MARFSWARPLFVAAVGLALVVPASGHTLSAAGGTPGRLIVAIVPLLVWPVAVGVRAFWHLRTVRMLTLLAIVLSVDTGLTYNQHHEKERGDLHSSARAGWRLNLAFPVARDADTSAPGNLALLAAIAGFTLAATAAAYVAAGRRLAAPFGPPVPGRPITIGGIAIGALAAVAATTAATAANGDWFRDEYLLGRATARQVAAAGLLSLDRCRICMTARAPAIDWTALEPNPARGLQSHLEASGRTIRLDVIVASDGGWTGFGRVRADFGDQSGTRWTPIVGERRFSHQYRQPGEYVVTVWLQLRDGSLRFDRRTVVVTEAP
jgi:hypothetical protein